MKKKEQYIIAVFLLIVTSALVCAQQNDPESNFVAAPMDGGRSVRITSYIGSSWTVRIPSQIQNIPVTHIADRAFNNKNLISITIPNTVIEIGESAFSWNQLTNVRTANPFYQDFNTTYARNGRKAGTYILVNGTWVLP